MKETKRGKGIGFQCTHQQILNEVTQKSNKERVTVNISSQLRPAHSVHACRISARHVSGM